MLMMMMIERPLGFVCHAFSPWGRNECVTNEPQRTSAGRLGMMIRVVMLIIILESLSFTYTANGKRQIQAENFSK